MRWDISHTSRGQREASSTSEAAARALTPAGGDLDHLLQLLGVLFCLAGHARSGRTKENPDGAPTACAGFPRGLTDGRPAAAKECCERVFWVYLTTRQAGLSIAFRRFRQRWRRVFSGLHFLEGAAKRSLAELHIILGVIAHRRPTSEPASKVSDPLARPLLRQEMGPRRQILLRHVILQALSLLVSPARPFAFVSTVSVRGSLICSGRSCGLRRVGGRVRRNGFDQASFGPNQISFGHQCVPQGQQPPAGALAGPPVARVVPRQVGEERLGQDALLGLPADALLLVLGEPRPRLLQPRRPGLGRQPLRLLGLDSGTAPAGRRVLSRPGPASPGCSLPARPTRPRWT